LLVPDWSAPGATTFFLNGVFEPDADQLRALAARGVVLERERVVSMSGEDRLVVHLGDGRSVALAGLFLAPRTRIDDPIPAALGCELEAGPLGPFLKVDPMMKETTVPGVFACGDIAVAAGTVATAVGDGARAGAAAHMSIIFR
jgi:thioredoxin reductase